MKLSRDAKTPYNALAASAILAAGFISSTISTYPYTIYPKQNFKLTNSILLSSDISLALAIHDEITTTQSIIQEIDNTFNEKTNYPNTINNNNWSAVSPIVDIHNVNNEQLPNNKVDHPELVASTTVWLSPSQPMTDFYGTNDDLTININNLTETYTDLHPFEETTIVLSPNNTATLEFIPFTSWQTIAVPSGQLSYTLTLDNSADNQETTVDVSGHLNEFTTIVESNFPITDGKVLYFGDGIAPTINRFGYHPSITNKELQKLAQSAGIPMTREQNIEHGIHELHKLGLTNSQIQTIIDFAHGNTLGAIESLLNPINFFDDLIDLIRFLYDEVVDFFENIFDHKEIVSASEPLSHNGRDAIITEYDRINGHDGYSQNNNLDPRINDIDSVIKPYNNYLRELDSDHLQIMNNILNHVDYLHQFNILLSDQSDQIDNHLDDIQQFDSNNILLEHDFSFPNEYLDFNLE